MSSCTIAIRSAALLLIAAALVRCSSPSPLPYAMPPAHVVALAAPLRSDVLAVLDFEDSRPPFERSSDEIAEKDIGGRYTSTDRFFTFHGEGRDLESDPAEPDDLRARVTGEAAFAWYPFPNHGVGRPYVAPLSTALPDYLALELEQRGLFTRVVRTHDAAQARAAGATLVLSGEIARFGAMFTEARDPFVVRPDDWMEYHLLAAAAYTAELKSLADDSSLLRKECLGRDEDLHLEDDLTPYRGAHWRPLYQLDATHLPDFARRDMAAKTRRSLERATAELVADLEGVLGAPPPIDGGSAPDAPAGK